MRSSAFSIFVAALLLTACGTEQTDPVQETAAPSTLHVRATGMVKSLGIT